MSWIDIDLSDHHEEVLKYAKGYIEEEYGIDLDSTDFKFAESLQDFRNTTDSSVLDFLREEFANIPKSYQKDILERMISDVKKEGILNYINRINRNI